MKRWQSLNQKGQLPMRLAWLILYPIVIVSVQAWTYTTSESLGYILQMWDGTDFLRLPNAVAILGAGICGVAALGVGSNNTTRPVLVSAAAINVLACQLILLSVHGRVSLVFLLGPSLAYAGLILTFAIIGLALRPKTPLLWQVRDFIREALYVLVALAFVDLIARFAREGLILGTVVVLSTEECIAKSIVFVVPPVLALAVVLFGRTSPLTPLKTAASEPA